MGRLFDEKGKSREVVRKWLEKQTVRGADPDRATNLQRILHSGDEKMTKNPVQASEKLASRCVITGRIRCKLRQIFQSS